MSAYFKRDRDTIYGVFTIQSDTGRKVFDRIKARSGQSAFTDSYWVTGKSPCPPGRFKLYTDSVNQGAKAGRYGIGESFPIGNVHRDVIQSKSGRSRRTLIRLHEENTYPGSAGCIVIVEEEEWKKVMEFLHSLKEEFIWIEVLQ